MSPQAKYSGGIQVAMKPAGSREKTSESSSEDPDKNYETSGTK